VGASAPTFAEDLAFLEAHGEVLVLEGEGGARVALSPTYQARVMTSATATDGPSLGWIHRAFIESGKRGTQFDNYGGEDRFWLGPEGGQFGLYFPEGAAFELDTWQTPPDLQEGAWAVTSRSPTRVSFARLLRVQSWSGERFEVQVERTVSLLTRADASRALGVAPGAGVAFVGFESENRITNAGDVAWSRERGLLSVWILGMFAPADDARVVIPFERDSGEEGRVVNDGYFGAVPESRLRVDEAAKVVVFSADGKHRSKIGVGPAHAKPVLGSYSAAGKVLTVVRYDGPRRGAPYVNSMWERQEAPFAGDAVNAYNDGAPAPGKPPLGGFYELETSSPAAELAPGASLTHVHRTFHFVGEPAALEPLSTSALGVSLASLHHM
jgi:hypothetical protein